MDLDIVDHRKLLELYDYLTLHIVPGPRSWKYFISLIFIFGALLTPETALSHRQLRTIFLPIIYVFQLYVWRVDSSFDVISMNAMLSAFMLLGWYDVRKDFTRVSAMADKEAKEHDSKNNTEYGQYPRTLQQRIPWVIDLLTAIRLTGWQTPANKKGLPTNPWTAPSELFYLSTIGKGICVYLVLDQTSRYVTSSPSFVKSLTNEAPLPWYMETAIMLLHLGCALALYNAFLPVALTAVLGPFPSLRHNQTISPLCWPAHFGPVSSIWHRGVPGTPLSKFWGIFWHQNMRYITSTPGVAIAYALGLGPGSKIRYLVIVSISFFFSGVVHMGVIPPKPLGTELSCWEMRVRLGSFFWIQSIGIALELLVAAARPLRIGPRTYQATSFVWVVSFLSLTAWCTIRPVGRELKWWNVYLVPVSIYNWM